jgi:hypothetical protein
MVTASGEAGHRGLLLRGGRHAPLVPGVRLVEQQETQRRVVGPRHEAHVPGLGDRAELELAVADDLAVAVRPLDRLVHLDQQCARRQLRRFSSV